VEWIVLGESGGKIRLVSKSTVGGMLPKGAFLTVETSQTKHILRVDDSIQEEPYSPSPLIAETDLGSLKEDQACQNIITASRVKDLTTRQDGLVDYIPPQLVARRSSQEEIDLATGAVPRGPKILIATLHTTQNVTLKDQQGAPIVARIPEDAFYHQILICGKTGSGKTVAAKYLAQYFVEELGGAVLAVNVKDIDLLQMDKPSQTTNQEVVGEWKALGSSPHPIDNFVIYHPPIIRMDGVRGVSLDRCEVITLDVREVDPEALTGLLLGISEVGAQNFPSIFRHWQRSKVDEGGANGFTFAEFVRYFDRAQVDNRVLPTQSARGEISEIKLHPGTYDNIRRNLNAAVDFFDNENAVSLQATDILTRGKMSVLNVASNLGIRFGAVMLRDLLHKIVDTKDRKQSDVPILIVIDEVHQFYDSNASLEALGDLDTICRTGRSKEIGVIFSSQSPSDIPRGLGSVINTQIFFKSDAATVKNVGIKVSDEEVAGLRKGFAVANIHELPQVRVAKFPLSYAGVIEERRP